MVEGKKNSRETIAHDRDMLYMCTHDVFSMLMLGDMGDEY